MYKKLHPLIFLVEVHYVLCEVLIESLYTTYTNTSLHGAEHAYDLNWDSKFVNLTEILIHYLINLCKFQDGIPTTSLPIYYPFNPAFIWRKETLIADRVVKVSCSSKDRNLTLRELIDGREQEIIYLWYNLSHINHHKMHYISSFHQRQF